MKFNFSSWGNSLYQGVKSYKIVQKRKWFYLASIVVVIACISISGIKGFNLGIEFTGGSEFQILNVKDVSQQKAIEEVKKTLPSSEPQITVSDNKNIKIRTEAVNDAQGIEIRDNLASAYSVNKDEITKNVIGPTWGNDILMKSLQGILVFLLIAAIFMTIYFRNIAMAVGGVIALFHDVIFTVGVYALVGWEITPATMIGFLTILGYSMYDTVVIFDKVRENTNHYENQTKSTYEELSNLAVNQTMVRSINTTIVALLPVGAVLFVGIFLMGAGTLRDIALALFVGMFIGAYSSIFLATPLCASVSLKQKKIKNHTEIVNQRRQKIADERGVEIEDVIQDSQFSTAQLLPGEHKGTRSQPRRNKKLAIKNQYKTNADKNNEQNLDKTDINTEIQE